MADSIESRSLDIPKHLERVSRSFAFCIARLDRPMCERVGLAYLMCRLLDTAEDAEWVPDVSGDVGTHRRRSIDQFVEILFREERDRARAEASAWAQELLSKTRHLPPGEVLLLKEANLIFSEFLRLPTEARDVLRPTIESMARGMREFATSRDQNAGRLTLQTLTEVNRYCFFVAGVVGELLTGLLQLEAKAKGIELRTSLADGFRFGLFLQKVNLLKDRETDLSEGRDLVPEVPGAPANGVFRSAMVDGRRALKYLSSIPLEFKSYRLFCAWSLFLGLASLANIRKGQRLGRIETIALLARIELRIDSNERLARLFLMKEKPMFPEPTKELVKESSEEDESARLEAYRRNYSGRASDEDLLDVATPFSYTSI